ncbi:helix-turn-helix domain protein [Streptococcus pneumoniae]|nr:helix-turn-helix domain protein [Streptococcus pneumoniae]
MQRLEVYKNYQHLYDLRIAILLNLSTLYLYNQDKNMCKQICYTLLEDAKNKKSYDRLAICYVRLKDKEKIINALQLHYSNAKLEATNNLIKLIKRNAFGFRNFENFKKRIFIALNIKKERTKFVLSRT